MRRSRFALFLTAVVVALSASPAHADVGDGAIPGLQAAASVVRDVDGVPHIKARNAHDLFFLHGWGHADDRLFQMDVTRRRGSPSRSCRTAASCPRLPGTAGSRSTPCPVASARTSAAGSSRTCSATG